MGRRERLFQLQTPTQKVEMRRRVTRGYQRVPPQVGGALSTAEGARKGDQTAIQIINESGGLRRLLEHAKELFRRPQNDITQPSRR